MVIYFTGTGNSGYVAEAIADRLGDEAVCSNDHIKRNETGSFSSERPWVFVFPVYLSTIAEIFADFIRKSEFKGSGKAYFIATCAGSMGSAPNIAEKICAAKGLEFMGAAKIQMPQNYIALFKMTEPDECERRLSEAKKAVGTICSMISAEQPVEAKFAGAVEYRATMLVEKLYNGHFTKTRKFYATDECIGCGLCVMVCPLNRITLSDGKPKWQGSCVHCMACINRCPKQAIEYGKGSAGKKRYVCGRYVSDKSRTE